jgi:membrane-associated phospholipid phosphatase
MLKTSVDIDRWKFKTRNLDEAVLLHLQTWRRQPLTWIFRLLTVTGTAASWFTLAFALYLLRWRGWVVLPEQNLFLKALLAPLAAWLAGKGLKRTFARPRPSAHIDGFLQVLPPPSCGSFPSSHAATSVSFFVGLVILNHPWAPYVGVWALAVSFSRLYLGVHYLTDVIGGIFLGALSAYFVLGTSL